MALETEGSNIEQSNIGVAIEKSEAKLKAKAHENRMVALAKSRMAALRARERAVEVREREVSSQETAPTMKAARALMNALRARERAFSGREAAMRRALKLEWDARELAFLAREGELKGSFENGLVACRETLATAAELDKARIAQLEKQLGSSAEQIASLMWHARSHIHPLTSKELEDLSFLDHEMRQMVNTAFENMSTVYPMITENEDSRL